MTNPTQKSISENVHRILSELPPGVELLAAVKGATPEAVQEVVGAGVKIIGESYVKEAETHYRTAEATLRQAQSLPRTQYGGERVMWHLIGHLQKNKVKKAVAFFDMIETVDSPGLAREIARQSALIGKTMPVLIEVNSGREPQKSGVLPEQVESLARQIFELSNIKLVGLMTIGSYSVYPEDYRPCFAETRRLFEKLNKRYKLNKLRYLSMGMSDSYKVAIEEGANIVRIGTKIFGERLR